MTQKSFLIIFITAIFVAVIGYFIVNSYNVLTRSFEGAKVVTFEQNEIQRKLSVMHITVRERTLVLLKMNAAKDAFELDDLRQEMRVNAEQFLLARRSLSEMGVANSALFQPLFKELDALTALGSTYKDKVADMFIDEKKREALDLLVDQATPVHVGILAMITEMKSASENEVRRTINRLNNEFKQARRNFQVIGLALLSIVLFVLSLVFYRILHRSDKIKGLLAHKEIQYEVIVDSVKDGILSMNRKGEINSFNHEAERIFGFTSDEIMGESIHCLIDKYEHAKLDSYINAISQGEEADGIDILGRKKDSRKIDLRLSLSSTDRSGEGFLSGVVQDVTREKANHNVLLRYREIFSKSDDAQAFVDMNHIYTMANDKYLKLFEKHSDDVIDFTVSEVIGETLFYTFEKAHQQCILNDEAVSFNQWVEVPSGLLYLSISYTPFHDASDKIVGIAIAIRDITEQKTAEDEYFRTSKLESVGVLAGGIAHDFNNMLSGIIGNIEMACHTLDDPDKAKKFLRTATKASGRAADLTQQLLTFSKGGEPVKESVRVCRFLEDVIEFSLHGSSIQRHMDCAENLWSIYADVGQISQVVQNIVINAKHAMPGGGQLTVVCSNVSGVSAELKKLTDTAADFVKITIADTGYGMAQEVLDSIFDPYFTTRKEGSGLGLALSYSIMNKHEGFITVESTQGKGSCFSLYLPASDLPVTKVKDDEVIVMKADNTKRIMIMDDDEMIREIAEAMLEELGYLVVQAQTGEEAVSLYQGSMTDSKQVVDLVIMDLTILGGMGGKEAVQAILAIDPDAKVIVSSGYSSDPVVANFSEYGFKAAVSKPYTMDELGLVLQQCL